MQVSRFVKMIILGTPGSGKGTIARRIARDFEVTHLSSGDLLRNHILNKSERGALLESYVNAGKLVPDDLMVKIIASELSQVKEKSLLLDGFPRTRPQAIELDQLEKLDLVLSLEVPHEVIIERLKGRWTHLPSGRIYNIDFNPPQVAFTDDVTGEALVQREDDKPEFIKDRLDEYDFHTLPLKEFYGEKNVLIEFHGTASNEIYPRIHKYLQGIIPSHSGPF